MKQIILGRSYGFLGTQGVNNYAMLRGSPFGGEWYTETNPLGGLFLHTHPWSVAGTFRNLYVEMLAPVENQGTISWDDTTFELIKVVAGVVVSTGLTVTVPAHAAVAQNGFASSASNISVPVSVAPGDQIGIVRYPSTISGGINGLFANIAWSVTFQSTNVGESGYSVGCLAGAFLNNSNIHVSAPLSGAANAFTVAPNTTTDVESHSIVAHASTLTRYDVLLHVAPGAGQSRTFVAVKNGVQQDGTGGTPDTRMTISGTATAGHYTGAGPHYAPLDLLSIYQLVPGTTPVLAHATLGVCLTADNDGESTLCFNGSSNKAIVDGSTDYIGSSNSGFAWTTAAGPVPAPAWRPTRYPTTELLLSLPGGLDAFTLKGQSVNASAAAGASGSIAYTLRKALATPVSGPTVSMGTADVLKVDPGNLSAAFAATTDRLDLMAVATGTPAPSAIGWAWLMLTTAPAPAAAPIYRTDVAGGIDDDEAFQAFIKTKAYPPSGRMNILGEIAEPFLTAKATAAELQCLADRDFGLKVTESAVDVTPEAAERHVIRKIEGTASADIGVIQFQIGDSAPASQTWGLDQLTVPVLDEGDR